MGGADQWGNITAGLELIRRVEGDDRAGRRPGPRPELSAPARRDRPEVRQDGGRDLRLARPGPDLAVRLLPVLARPGRRRGRPPAADVHPQRPGRDRGDRGRGGGPARGAPRPAGAGGRPDRRGSMAPTVLDRVQEVSEAVFSRTLPSLGPEMLGVRLRAAARTRSCRPRSWPTAVRSPCPWRPACSARTARRAGRSARAACRSTRSGSARPMRPVPAPLPGGYLVLRSGKKAYRIVWVTARPRTRARARSRRTSMHRRRLEAALGEQDEGVEEEVGGLAAERRAGRVALALPAASAAASSLAAIRTSVASSVTFRPAASTPPSSRLVVYEPAGRFAARSAIVAQSVSSQAKPWPGPGEPGRRRGRSSSGSRDGRSARPGRRSGAGRRRRSRARSRRGAGRCRSSRPCATAGRGSASGSGPRRSRGSPRAPRGRPRPSIRTRPSARSWTIAGSRPPSAGPGDRSSGSKRRASRSRRPRRARSGPPGRPRPSPP